MRGRPGLVAWALLVVATMAIFAWNAEDEASQIFASAIIVSGVLVVVCEKP